MKRREKEERMARKTWLKTAGAVMAGLNRFLFFVFLPEKKHLTLLDRMMYRFLVKMVFVEKRISNLVENGEEHGSGLFPGDAALAQDSARS
jgi:hypothetical protein